MYNCLRNTRCAVLQFCFFCTLHSVTLPYWAAFTVLHDQTNTILNEDHPICYGYKEYRQVRVTQKLYSLQIFFLFLPPLVCDTVFHTKYC